MRKNSATAFAPATTGNVGVGFDILGVALHAIGDTVKVTKTKHVGHIEIIGASRDGIPSNPELNTATVGLIQMLEDFRLPMGFEVKIKKGIPLGSGMGGSAASAVAGVFAANALLPKPLSKNELLKYALAGEAVATGAVHGDNVAPCLFGGLSLITAADTIEIKYRVVNLPFPQNLVIVIVLPKLRLDTKKARGVLTHQITLKNHVTQSGHLANFIVACYNKDLGLIKAAFKDVIIEPQRAHLIDGFYEVKRAALDAGALGCTISGAGPAIFAIAPKVSALKIRQAMVAAFKSVPVAGAWISPVNKKGVHLL